MKISKENALLEFEFDQKVINTPEGMNIFACTSLDLYILGKVVPFGKTRANARYHSSLNL